MVVNVVFVAVCSFAVSLFFAAASLPRSVCLFALRLTNCCPALSIYLSMYLCIYVCIYALAAHSAIPCWSPCCCWCSHCCCCSVTPLLPMFQFLPSSLLHCELVWAALTLCIIEVWHALHNAVCHALHTVLLLPVHSGVVEKTDPSREIESRKIETYFKFSLSSCKYFRIFKNTST